MLLLEVILRTVGDPFLPEDGYPPYPDKSAVQLNAEINRIHYTNAEKHRFGFNEVDRGPDKKPGTYRIAVVGDSFVYGDGATDAIRWTRRLERATTLEFDNVEIRHWGRNGWSTIKQVEFLRGHLRSYAIDAIVVGWVRGEPPAPTGCISPAINATRCSSPRSVGPVSIRGNLPTNGRVDSKEHKIDPFVRARTDRRSA